LGGWGCPLGLEVEQLTVEAVAGGKRLGGPKQLGAVEGGLESTDRLTQDGAKRGP